MGRGVVWLAAAFVALAGACSAAPLQLYGGLPSIESAALSGDGAMVAIVATNGEQRVVVVRRVDDPKPLMSIQAGPTKVRGLRWVGPDHLLITASYSGKMADVISAQAEWVEVIDINVKAGTQMNLLGGARGSIPATIRPPQIRFLSGKPFAFVEAFHFVAGQGVDSLFRVNLSNGDTTLIAEGRPDTSAWLVGGDGLPLVESRYNAKLSQWALLVRRGDIWRLADVRQTDFGYQGVLGLGRDGRSVLASADRGDALRELPPGGDTWSVPFSVPDDRNLIEDPADGRLLGDYALIGDTDRYTFFAPADQAIWDAAVGHFPGAGVELAGLSDDHQTVLVGLDSTTDGPGYAIFDNRTGGVRMLGGVYAGLTADDIAPVQSIAFTAADGLPLTGYLTLPQGREPKGLPLVVLPHGGPAARDEPGFDWWAQALASRGYAVLQVNYRGSDGFGEAFLEAGFGQWGGKMQTDLSDGVRYLAAKGTIDPKRVCIVGASYGGYAALAGVTLDPGVYRCAVSVAGPSDLGRFVAWSGDRSSLAAERYWSRYMGAAGPTDPHLAQISPIDHIDGLSAPILLIHGKDDTVVPFEQSQLMADALKRAGKPYEFVVLNHEDHWLSQGQTRLQMLQATLDFLEKNNPAG